MSVWLNTHFLLLHTYSTLPPPQKTLCRGITPPSPTICSAHPPLLPLHLRPTTFPLSLSTLLHLSLPSLPTSPLPHCSVMVDGSRQVLQEPDFSQLLLLRDAGAPVVRKSRGTSTQGTSTRASSTHLAALDEPPSGGSSGGGSSRSGSAHSARSKTSSFHGSLQRSRDGRWVEFNRLTIVYFSAV